MSQKDDIVPMEAVPERKAARQQSGETSRGNEEYFKSLDEALEEALRDEAETSTKPKIQKIPFMLRDNDNFKKYLEPRVVSIGPFHAKNSNLQVTKWMKLKLAALFIQEDDMDRNLLYETILEKIADFKGCYTDEATEGYNNEELAWMFLVDGCALLHYMIICGIEKKEVRHDMLKRLKIKKDHMEFVQQDVFLLDNQLPYKLLDLLIGLSNKQCKEKELKHSLEKFILDSINAPPDLYEANQKNYRKAWKDKKPLHLLDLLRTTLIQPDNEKDASHATITMRERSQKPKKLKEILGVKVFETGKKLTDALTFKKKHVWHSSFRNIEELKAAGISLKPSETSSMKSISFSGGTLKIPPIVVDDWTEAKLLNLAAYEMCPDFQNDFEVSTYIFFMDSLIDRAKDAKELRESGILHNALGSDKQVAKLFNKISTDLVPNQMYEVVRRKIQSHCDNKWITWRAQFCARHFHSPWSALAFSAAIIVVASAIVQTVYTVLSLDISTGPGV
ncbi:hypothetical protein EZV62_005117 [Acer yangbiense]|uniref:Uncharacterized protein n=1 Tax=Acer yangbiense TaxID=1000413 RepID=A0A5C7IP02_9ROSI|nr:hypothetical protein EZV62_005117 [Acer yangbiense]